MSRTFGEITGLRFILTRMLIREAEASGQKATFLENELRGCLTDLAGATINADSLAEADSIRNEAGATISTIFKGIRTS